MADVDQLVPFEYAQDEGAEMLSPPSRLGESGDHPLLGELRLHLQPLPAPFPHLVRALSMLGDYPLESLSLDDMKKQDPVFPYVIAEPYFRGGRENLFQEFLSAEQGEAGQVMPLEVDEIEDVVEQMTASGFLVILQQLEIGMAPIIHDDNFAIQDGLKSEFAQRVHDGSILLVQRDQVAGIERDVSVPDLGDGPVAVPFHFEDPVLMVERLPDQGRKHRSYAVRHRCSRRILQLFAFHRFPKTNLVYFCLTGFLRAGFEHLLQRLIGHDRTVLLENVPRACIAVFFLQEEPRLLVLPRLDQREFALQLFPRKDKLQVPLSQAGQKKLLAFFFIP